MKQHKTATPGLVVARDPNAWSTGRSNHPYIVLHEASGKRVCGYFPTLADAKEVAVELSAVDWRRTVETITADEKAIALARKWMAH